jgi:hypothetical protein
MCGFHYPNPVQPTELTVLNCDKSIADAFTQDFLQSRRQRERGLARTDGVNISNVLSKSFTSFYLVNL